MMTRTMALAAGLSLAAALVQPAAAGPVALPTFAAQVQPVPDATVAYGEMEVQSIDVFLPKTRGPHPVAILIHGGCWMKRTAGREQLRPVWRALAERGIAVWSIGYRRVDEDGGAYPGIYRDVATAIDLLPATAAKYELDMSRVVAVGHSAGAHLALWAASRGRIAPSSPLFTANPFPIRTVIGLGGVGDLERATGLSGVCEPAIVSALIGSPSDAR